MSMEPALRASISAGPALNTDSLIVVPEPSSSAKKPSFRPTSGVAWVRFAK